MELILGLFLGQIAGATLLYGIETWRSNRAWAAYQRWRAENPRKGSFVAATVITLPEKGAE